MKYRFALLDNFCVNNREASQVALTNFLGKLTVEAKKTHKIVIEKDPMKIY